MSGLTPRMTSTPRGHLGALRRHEHGSTPRRTPVGTPRTTGTHEDLSSVTGKHAAFEERRGSEGARSGTRPEVRRPSQAESSDGSPQERKTPGMMMSSRDLNKRLRMERSNTMELADRRASTIRKERELREAKLPTAWKWESAPMVLHLCGASAYTVDAKTLRWLLQEPAPPTAAQRLCFCQHAASRQAAWREPASAGLDAAARVPEKLRGVMAVGDGASVSLHTCAVAPFSAQCSAQFSAQCCAQFCVAILSDAPHPLLSQVRLRGVG